MGLQHTVLEAKEICKSFYDNLVLDHINFSCRTGEIHTLVGENGAGKSTLMRIFSGVYLPTSGEIVLNGEVIKFTDTLQAQNAGIGIIHQEFNLAPHLSVAENIFLGRYKRRKSGNIDFPAMKKRTLELTKLMNMKIDPDKAVKELTVAQQQMVEIMKAIELDTQIIIMDEPTAALSPTEVKSLFRMMRHLRDEGRTIIYISHRLNEIFEISDRITILKDGRMVATKNTSETTKDEVVNLMVGRKLDNIFPSRDKAQLGRICIEVKNLVISQGKSATGFAARRGEVVGITGLEGQGQREILRTLFGLHRPAAGEIIVNGKKVSIRNTKDAMKQSITFLTDDRKNEGLCLDLPIFRNISLPVFKKLKKGPVIMVKQEKKEAQKYMEQMNIKAENSNKLVRKLSGGNQQKVLLGKCLSPGPEILLIHEPTRGIDVAAKVEIYNLLKELARREKVCIIMVSSDLVEVLHICDRILVVYNGCINGQLEAEGTTEEDVMRLATNIVKEGAV